MALIERIRGKLLPVRPNLFQHFRVVAILLSALDELGIHVIQLFYQLLTHSLTQCIALASRKIGQLTGQQHHLLLIHRDTVCVFQILLHTRYVVFHRVTSLFTVDKVGYIVHRSRTVKRIHGNKVLECGRLQFAQILLHAGGFELERPDGASVAIQTIGGRVRNVQCVHVYFHPETVVDVGLAFLDDGKGLQPQKVHLDQSRVFNHGTFVLRTAELLSRFLVLGCADRHPIGHVVTTDDHTAGMHARVPHITLQHPGITDGVAQQRIRRCLGLLQLRNTRDGIREIHFTRLAVFVVRQLVRYELTQSVGNVQRQLFHPGHILYGQFRGHRTIGNDMRHFLFTVFLRHPTQDLSASVIVEIHVDIGQ